MSPSVESEDNPNSSSIDWESSTSILPDEDNYSSIVKSEYFVNEERTSTLERAETSFVMPVSTERRRSSNKEKVIDPEEEQEETASRIHAILEQYNERLQTSPELSKQPARRIRSDLPEHLKTSSKRLFKKSSKSSSSSSTSDDL